MYPTVYSNNHQYAASNNQFASFNNYKIVKRPSAVSFAWKRINMHPSIMFYLSWKISIIPERENIQAYEVSILSYSNVLGHVSYVLNDNREQVEWDVGIPWNGNSFGNTIQAVVRVKINNIWSNWSDSATVSIIQNELSNNQTPTELSDTKLYRQQQLDRRVRCFNRAPLQFQHSPLSIAKNGSVSYPSSYIILFPGAGGFGLNSGPDGLYSGINNEFSTNAHVITVTFDDYRTVQKTIIEVMTELILLLPESAPVVLIGWSFGGAVALELAVKLNGRNIAGVVTIAGQGADVSGKQNIFGIESLQAPLLFIAGTADTVFGGARGAVRIATEFHKRAERSIDKRLYIMPEAFHDCQGCKSYLYDWLKAHLHIR